MLPFASALVLANIGCLAWTIRIYLRRRRGVHLAVCILAALSLLLACTGLVYALRAERLRRQPLPGPVRPAALQCPNSGNNIRD